MALLTAILNAFGLVSPIADVVEFIVVLMAVGYGIEIVKGIGKKK
jgi:hypothetical protein